MLDIHIRRYTEKFGIGKYLASSILLTFSNYVWIHGYELQIVKINAKNAFFNNKKRSLSAPGKCLI